MVKKKFIARNEGAGIIARKDAQIVGEELETIKTSFGELNISNVLRTAKKKNSILHTYFEWDDTIAGAKFREQQARNLISCVAEVIVVNNKEVEAKSFYCIRKGRKKGAGAKYVNLKDIKRNSGYKDELLNNAIAHLKNTTRFLEMLRTA